MPWLGRISPVLAAIAHDGRYLSGIPVLGVLLAPVGISIGFMAGLMDRDGLPYTASIGMLAVLMGLGIFSGRAGLWCFLGFIVADALTLFRAQTTEPSWAYGGAIVLSWFFLFQLVALLPLAARQMAGLAGRWSVLNGLISAILVTAFADLWTRLSMVALRPLFTWRGEETPLELVYFADPSNEWSLGLLVMHKLAWAAMAAALLRWLAENATARLLPLTVGSITQPLPQTRSQASWWLAAMAKAATSTAIIAGVFASVAGAVAFWLAILGAIAMRTFISANRFVARWDGWMSRIPVAIRLIASYALCFYLAAVLVELLRGSWEWRTMTTTAAVAATVFTVSLALWPQVAPGTVAPRPPAAIARLLRSAGQASPRIALLLLTFSATAAFAHHCSFQPGCECLTDNRALAALIAAWATLGQLWGGLWRLAGRPLPDDPSQPALPVHELADDASATPPVSQPPPSHQPVEVPDIDTATANTVRIEKAIRESWNLETVGNLPNYANCSGLVSAVSAAIGIDGLTGKAARGQLEYLLANSGPAGPWEDLGTDHQLATQRATEGQFVIAVQIADGVPGKDGYVAPRGGHVAIVMPGIVTDGAFAGWPKASWGMIDNVGEIDGALRHSFMSRDLDNGRIGYFSISIPSE